MRQVNVVGIQTAAGGIDLAFIGEALEAAGSADLVVFPELCHLPYFPLEHNDEWRERAVDSEDDFVRAVKSMAAEKHCHVVLPLYVREGERLYNAAYLIGPDGEFLLGRDASGHPRSVYHKVHLCDIRLKGTGFYESTYFAPGEGPVVWETNFGTLGILICYDRHFPEAWRTMRALGAEIVAVPVASPAGTAPTFIPEMQAMALQQEVYVVVANRTGTETLESSNLTTEFLGHSCVVGPTGVVLSSGSRSGPEVVMANLDPDALVQVRSDIPLAEHRRPDAYVLGPVEEARA